MSTFSTNSTTVARWRMGRLAMLAMLALMIVLAGCAMPRSGPNKKEIYSGAIERGGDAHVIYVNRHVTQTANYQPAYGFGPDFLAATQVQADTIRPGDTLGLQIWENVDDGLLTSLGQSSTALQELQVDSDGFIFVPYAGRVQAAGNSPESLRRVITERLGSQTPDPQVQVTRVAGDGATITVGGKVGSQGVYPLERPTRTLSAMLARAGGVSIDPEIAVVTVKRGTASGKVWLRDLYANSRNDIAMRAGDVVLVDEDQRSFTALGALGGQTRVPLGSEDVNALEGIALVGGLSSNSADPTGVFIMRDEPESVARRVLGTNSVYGTQRFVYALDLTRPNGMFLARDFMIRDGDTVYVTEAPFSRTRKMMGAVTGTLGTAGSIRNLAD